MRKTGDLFPVLVVWRVSYASAKNLEREGSIYSFSFYGKMVRSQDELSFKEMRMWGQSKISSCDSIEMEGRGGGRSKITNTNGGKLLCRPSSSYKKLLDRVTF